MQELYPLLEESEALVSAAPIYYFMMPAQLQAPLQHIYNMNNLPKLKKMALLLSSHAPDVNDRAIGECLGIRAYWGVEDANTVTAKFDEQKTDASRAKVTALATKL